MIDSPAWAGEKKYSFGVVPQATPLVMHSKWAPFLEKLSAALGVKFNLKVYREFESFESDLADGVVDFAFMTPIQQARGTVRDNYIPIVRSTMKIGGILFVRKDSPINSVEELDNSTIAFVGENNVCSILVSNLLHKTGELSYSPVFAGSVDNVAKNVLIGKSQAGAFLDVTMAQQPEEIREQLRILVETQQVPAHPISAHRRVPAAFREQVRQAVLDMSSDPSAAALFKAIGMPSPVRADYQEDYLPIEQYGLYFVGTP
jgi:phosphonate transport system substrate-binding protein